MIDYENVNTDGLIGCEKLGKKDHIVIFFTQNAKKIDMSEIANHGESELSMVEIPAGKQSADIHIGSYLGYLVGRYKDEGCCVVIVSKDTDFDKVIKFWKDKTRFTISRVQQIKDYSDAPKTDKAKKADDKKTPAKDKASMNDEIMKLLSKAGYPNEIVTQVASVAVKNFDVKNGKQQIYRTIISKYGQEKGLEIYNQIRKQI